MIDITHKSNTLRQATAQAVVKVSKQETIDAIKNKAVPKGDVFEMAKTAGLFAVKHTPDMIPDCHPMPVEYTAVSFDIQGLKIHIELVVKTIYKTGVEVEAMHGASVIALTIYDMLKPLDKEIEILSIKLLKKSGGKSDFHDILTEPLHAVVIVSSDSVSKGKKEDRAGKIVIEKLENFKITVDDYIILPDEPEQLRKKVEQYCENGINLVIITGGTGLSPRDNTIDAIKPLIDKDIPGIMEAARAYGQQRTPYAMVSRSIAGLKRNTLILAIPGSSKGAAETMDALFPSVLHIFKVQEYGFKH